MPSKQPTKSAKVVSNNDTLEKKRHEFQEQIAHKRMPTYHQLKKKLFIGIALLVALLVGLAVVAVYVFWYQNPNRVVADAIMRAFDANTTTFTGSFQLGSVLSINANGGLAGAKGGNLTFTAKTGVGSKSSSFGSDVVMDQNGDLYVSGSGIESALGSALVSSAITPGSYANILQQKLEGKWLEITSDQLAPYSKRYAAIQSCVQTVIQRIQNDQPLLGELSSIYQQDQFFVVDKTLGVENGSTGYSVHVNQMKLTDFLNQFKDTSIYQQFYNCDSATFNLNVDNVVNDFNPTSTSFKDFDIWINAQHAITSINSTTDFGDLPGALTIQLQFNQPVKVIVPTETVSLAQVHQYLVEGTQALALSTLTDSASQQEYQALINNLKTTQ